MQMVLQTDGPEQCSSWQAGAAAAAGWSPLLPSLPAVCLADLRAGTPLRVLPPLLADMLMLAAFTRPASTYSRGGRKRHVRRAAWLAAAPPDRPAGFWQAASPDASWCPAWLAVHVAAGVQPDPAGLGAGNAQQGSVPALQLRAAVAGKLRPALEHASQPHNRRVQRGPGHGPWEARRRAIPACCHPRRHPPPRSQPGRRASEKLVKGGRARKAARRAHL